LDQDQLVREVVDQLQTAFGYYHVQIYLFDHLKMNLVMVGGTGDAGRALLSRGHTLQKGQGLVGKSAENNQVILIPDVTQAGYWLANPLLPETKSELAVPIVLGDDVLGVLDVQHDVTNGLSDGDSDLIQSIANQVAIAVRNAQAYSHTQKQAHREAQITAISQQIQSASTIEDVLKIAISELGNVLGASRSMIDLQVTAISPNERI
jgi:GAF domain-containing protein